MKKMNFKTAFIILGSIVALSIAIHVPLAWFFGWHISDNGTVSMFVNEFAFDTINLLYYFYVVVKFILPMLILIVTSILIIKKVPIDLPSIYHLK